MSKDQEIKKAGDIADDQAVVGQSIFGGSIVEGVTKNPLVVGAVGITCVMLGRMFSTKSSGLELNKGMRNRVAAQAIAIAAIAGTYLYTQSEDTKRRRDAMNRR